MFSAKKSFGQRLLAWYRQHRRDLPWRTAAGTRPDPYHVLVSEAMLQQTQVATVVPYFQNFIKHLPSLSDLAAADEQLVLTLWQGLGYYSRARNLRAAARKIIAEHDGKIPQKIEALLQLPGIGRYTAGAIASLAYDVPAPILDGNVARVLCRIDRIETDPRDRATTKLLWQRAEEILPKKAAGDFNSALMELGATVCTPRNPQCLICPVRLHCEAFAAGVQDRIPPPRKAKPTPLIQRRTFCIRHKQTWLIEQRPSKGRWAGMWQFVTIETGQPPLLRLRKPRRIGLIEHTLTHRRYQFEVFVSNAAKPVRSAKTDPLRRWVRLDDLHQYPLPRPHVRIAEILRNLNTV